MKYKIGSLIYVDYISPMLNKRLKGTYIITGYNERYYILNTCIHSMLGNKFAINSVFEKGIRFTIE